MNITKDKKKENERKSVLIPASLHHEIKKLSFENRTSMKKIIAKSIDLYRKASIFDNLR